MRYYSDRKTRGLETDYWARSRRTTGSTSCNGIQGGYSYEIDGATHVIGQDGEAELPADVIDETHPAAFRVDGTDWRWDVGCNEHSAAHSFAFVIEPDGTGLYYNFRASTDGTAAPSDLFDCVMAP